MLEIVCSRKKFLGDQKKLLIFFLNLTLLLIAQSQMWQRDRHDSVCLMEEFLDGGVSLRHIPSSKQIPSWAIVEPPADKDQ